jgi:hypothetical protein
MWQASSLPAVSVRIISRMASGCMPCGASTTGGQWPSLTLSYLYTLAALSVTFVGFSSLVIVLRQTMGGEMSKLDIFITRTFIQVGFLVAAGAMLPGLLTQFQSPQESTWRLSSAVTAVPVLFFACTYPARRKGVSGA